MGRIVAAGVAALVFAAGAAADVAVITSSLDNTLYQDVNGTLSNGAGESFFVGETGTGSIRRGLIRFNVAGAVPPGSMITGVSLALNLSQTIATDQNISLYRCLKDWGEGTSVANGPGNHGGGGGATATPGDATWVFRFYPAQPWGTPGGSSSGASPDFAAAASGATTVGMTTQVYTWASTPAMVADAQGWLDSPSTNFGWFVIGGESVPGSAKRFDTRENQTAANRPALTITFTPPGGSCYPNCDGTTTVPFLNVNDFICFQGRFAAGDSYANCDGSTNIPVLNVNDFICFQGRFAAGCSAP